MINSRLHLESNANVVGRFRTAVSLHSHTLHSQETLCFVNRLGKRFAPLGTVLRRGQMHYRRAHGTALDLSRAWWTPPASPRHAWHLERSQIQDRLGLHALVSLTDHDSIEAPLSLRVLTEAQSLPVSVEWTVPYGPTFFHLGIHNLPAETAPDVFRELQTYTRCPEEALLMQLLESISRYKETLIVFNHPGWDEKSVGYDRHIGAVLGFTRKYREWLHALELNGLRPWSENRAVLRLAQDLEMPLVSGGDRHALEPNTVLDLTNAETFSEYADQVRRGYTDVVFMPQYRESFPLRILQNLEEILADHPDHGRGWTSWSDRVFYRCDDGEVRSLSQLFCNRVPGAVRAFVGAIETIRRWRLRDSCRVAFPRRPLLP